ncbi:MAG: tetratricopeptide repeat protein [Verrucomicrobia bacterium]|nr:tetratricopeptide repeat protein [Verrucomicrobiota bacterium]MCH8513517.1 tetratricopeptide repeat protein [Kiritimatiellia bacterium]
MDPLRKKTLRKRWLATSALIALLAGGLTGCGRSVPPLPPQDVISEARARMLAFHFGQAKTILDQQAPHFPEDHPLYPEFLYLQALSNWHAVPPVPNDVRNAAVQLAEMAEAYPDHELAPNALLYMGRIHDIRDFAGDEPDYPAARNAYQLILERYPDHPVAADAAIRYGMTYVKQVAQPEEIAKGVAFIRSWYEENPETPMAPIITLFLGNMYDQFLGDRAQALQFYDKASRLGFVNAGRAGVNLWRKAELAIEVGLESLGKPIPPDGWSAWEFDGIPESYLQTAIKTCQTIITEYPRSGRGYEALLVLRAIRESRPELEFEIPVLQLFEISDAEDPS